jgi:N-acetylglucosamine-6-sulfatase
VNGYATSNDSRYQENLDMPRILLLVNTVLLGLLLGGLHSSMAVSAAAELSPQDMKQPNIVVLLVDDLRWDELGCTGHPFVRTPHIDRIAHEGMRFRNAFCTTPLCSPVRASLLTGLTTHHHGILDNTNRSDASHKLETFPRVLQRAGYETAYVGKWHMGNDDTARPGFDHWVSMKGQGTSFDPVLNVDGHQIKHSGHTTDVLNEKAVAFVRRKRDKPFCLYVAHKALHPELVQHDDGSISDQFHSRLAAARETLRE